MIETGSTAQPPSALIKDSSEATFIQDVVETSQSVPVIVDFWAPWCGPCKSLGPALEAAVNRAGGKVKMVKVNVDENQMIASQMRVQSIPAVFAFVDGKPVDGFTGNQTPAEIDAFVDRVAGAAGADDVSEALDVAARHAAEGAPVEAAQIYASILSAMPDNAAAYAGLAKAHLALGETEQARGLLQNLPDPSMAQAAEIIAVLAQLELNEAAANAGPLQDLQSAVAANPDDLQARLDLAVALLAAGDAKAAIDELLDVFRRDREWNDEAAKSQLFKIFESLGPQDPVAQSGRRRLSSMIFA